MCHCKRIKFEKGFKNLGFWEDHKFPGFKYSQNQRVERTMVNLLVFGELHILQWRDSVLVSPRLPGRLSWLVSSVRSAQIYNTISLVSAEIFLEME